MSSNVSGTFKYEHCINGPNGFVKESTQSVEIQPDSKVVHLMSGSVRVVQEWRRGLPWPVHTDVNNGLMIAELVEGSVTTWIEADTVEERLKMPVEISDIDSIEEFGAPTEGRWWPMSATVSRLPWSRGSAGEGGMIEALDIIVSIPPWSGYWWPQLEGNGGEGIMLDEKDVHNMFMSVLDDPRHDTDAVREVFSTLVRSTLKY